MIEYDQAAERLQAQGQEHVLRFFDGLDDSQQRALLKQIDELDFESIESMQELLEDSGNAESTAHETIEPADVVSFSDAERSRSRERGEEALRQGKVGVILVAGGQGSRLGYDGPKGCFPVGPLTDASLFEIHSRKILALERTYGSRVPFYIMTSEVNDGPTREFFEQNDYFGLDPERVHFFVQGMWPALTKEGKLILDRPDHIFQSPDGHGGTLRALKVNGKLAAMRNRGVETLFYFQVDNPLVEVADPAFIGLHLQQNADVSVKVCAKRGPDEGLGVVVRRGESNAIVEYTELTKEQKEARDESGELRFKYGSVAIHVFSREFLEQEASRRLPLHLAHKKVPYCNEEGETVEPDSPNAYKFEKFIFDTIPDAERTVNLEFKREDEFSPVKNAEGNDSPSTARRDMMRKWARWFEACGIELPRNDEGDLQLKIEIDPCFALTAEQLKQQLPPDFKVDGGVLLEAK